MRVLWLSHFLPYPPKGGLLQRGYYLLKELGRHVELDLLSFNQPRLLEPLLPSAVDAVQEAVDHLASFCRVLAVENIPYSASRFGREWIALRSLLGSAPYSVNWLNSTSFQELVRAALRREYDAVHLDTISLAPYGAVVAAQAPHVATSLGHHNIESHMLLRRARAAANPLEKAYFWQEGFRLERYERRACPRFDLHIVCSDLDAQRLADVADVPHVAVIPNAVDTSYSLPVDRRRSASRLVFVGTMNWYPNVDAMRFFLSQVWPILIAKLPDVSLDIIGANPPLELVKLANRLARVRVLGFVDDLRAHLNDAGAFVCPVRDGGGTKLKVLDAFVWGVPMVAHPIACEGIPVEEGKHVLLAREPEEFATSIQRLLGDSQLQLQLATAARALVEEHFSAVTIGRRLFDELSASAHRKSEHRPRALSPTISGQEARQ